MADDPRDFDALALDDLQDHNLAARCVAGLLRQRELTLLLGAGVSMGVGLPSWRTLVERCEAAVGIKASTGPRAAPELMRAIDGVQRAVGGADDELIRVVHRALYEGIDLSSGEYDLAFIKNDMLIALGALVMASARGSVSDVFTLNFDDLLEWHLRLHGYRVQVVSELPVDLRGDVDVTVFHPHGFVPLSGTAYSGSDWLVLSYQQLVDRLAADAGSPWPTLLSSRFLLKRFLAVGTSMNDLDVDVLLRRARVARKGTAYLGFVVDANISREDRAALLDSGVVPVSFGDLSEIPSFLLTVCQIAALP